MFQLIWMDTPLPDGKDHSLVHVVDDDNGIRAALRLALTIAGHAVRVYDSAPAFLSAVEPHEGGCVITDMRMPEMSGLDLLEAMNAQAIRLPTIVITAYGEIPLAVEAMKLGAVDFLEKPFDNAVLIEAVSQALRRERDGVREEETRRSQALLATLTARERDVLAGLLKGHQNKVIAHALGVSTRTVESHRAHIMDKMNAGNLRELMRMFLFVPIDP
ncbi:LuxR family two component transcriptional regulator [Roseiarcus fermentans]|uniref:LuxR family two component transcriptional regulator n=1 Tax=Roseiarcus fermentans TaxID=1473586 RepID=A0A366ERR5_9HYPH|nr:response regulator [Roseiarcus fermentans]RBP05122.1 LuxR family two component transcriptional regulator [Roseiarcus fermentans]